MEANHSIIKTGLHAEVAGGGLGGLAAAVGLAKAGWSVRLHERSPEIRASGSGIYVAENGCRVLEALGIEVNTLKDCHRFFRRELRDGKNRLTAWDQWPAGSDFRVYFVRRENLVKALLSAAFANGVEVVCGSEAVGADPAGRLLMRDGRAFAADLVIAADGVGSPVRNSLGIPFMKTPEIEGAARAIVERRNEPHLPKDTYVEWWAGNRRFFYAPLSEKRAYACLIGPTNDPRIASGSDLSAWEASFPLPAPVLGDIVEFVPFAPFIKVKLENWTSGKVAVIGDAAHAMTPNLGQGGGTAMMDGLSIAFNVSQTGCSVEDGLAKWQARQRPVIDRVQRIAGMYGKFSQWPALPRSVALSILGASKWVRNRRLEAAHFIPDGARGAQGSQSVPPSR